MIDLNKLKPLNQSYVYTQQELCDIVPSLLNVKLLECKYTHHTRSVVLICEEAQDMKFVIKLEQGFNIETTRKELRWYKTVEQIDGVAKLLKAYEKQYIVAFIIEYAQNGKTLDLILHDNTCINAQITKTIHWIKNLYYSKDMHKQVAIEEYSKNMQKYNNRMNSIVFPQLTKLCKMENICVNGIWLQNYENCLSQIVADETLLNKYMSDSVGIIHGDLHLANIIQSQDCLYYVDPNGTNNLPIEYDYGKLLQSVHGGYHHILNGEYDLKHVREDKYNFESECTDKDISAYNTIKNNLTEEEYNKALFYEAMHFATMLAHHQYGEEKIALHLKGLQLMNGLLQ